MKEVYKVEYDLGIFLDYLSILEIKSEKGYDVPGLLAFQRQKEGLVESSEEVAMAYLKLKHINSLIWWCMDFQRDYEKEESARGMIALITAELNDARDSIKSKLGNSLFSKTYSEV